MAPLVEYKNVEKYFGKTKALDGLTLSVEPGSIYGLLGRNGAGKTTALRLISGLETYDTGEVLVFGKRPGRLNDVERAQVSYAGEGQVLVPSMKISEVISFVRRATPDWDEALCSAILDEGRIQRDKKVRTLSKGMRQRLRLALAYARRPRVLVLDEPAEGLDTIVRFGLFSRVIDVVAEREACAIISSHVLGDVERIADRIGFISAGKILLEGSLDDLKEHVRRVRLAWSHRSDPGAGLEAELEKCGAVSYRKTGRQASFVVPLFDNEWLAAFRGRFGDCVVDVDLMNLEEIFIELLRDEP